MDVYLLKKRLAAATIILLVFAVGLWTGWHKDEIFARLSRWHSELTRTIPSPSPSPGPLTLTKSSLEATAQTPSPSPSPSTLTESSVEAMAQTPASWDSEITFNPLHSNAAGPSLVDQLLRE